VEKRAAANLHIGAFAAIAHADTFDDGHVPAPRLGAFVKGFEDFQGPLAHTPRATGPAIATHKNFSFFVHIFNLGGQGLGVKGAASLLTFQPGEGARCAQQEPTKERVFMNTKFALIALAAFVVGGIAITVMKSNEPKNMSMNGHSTPQGHVFTPNEVKLPAFNLTEMRGQAAYDQHCAACHGEKAVGTEQGPSFLHRVYVPGHHGDHAFFSAMQNGVTQHHWPFGDMAAQPQVSTGDAAAIIAYVRALQGVNGFGN